MAPGLGASIGNSLSLYCNRKRKDMKIKVINVDSISDWAQDKGIEEPWWEDLTDEQFSEINEEYEDGWSFDSIEDFVWSFNTDDNDCPVPTAHILRIFNE